MLKKTITYTDYDGNERTEDFYFNLTKAELLKMDLTTAGGLVAKYNKIVAAKDPDIIIKEFDRIVEASYCIKSDDGRRLIKSKEAYKAFTETPAYEDLFMELITSEDKSSEFMKAICPVVETSAISAPPVK